jgi:hypothetical protein
MALPNCRRKAHQELLTQLCVRKDRVVVRPYAAAVVRFRWTPVTSPLSLRRAESGLVSGFQANACKGVNESAALGCVIDRNRCSSAPDSMGLVK